ncbi:MAG: tetratricopeptide repeat protein [Thermaurantimonas sp.]
MRMEIRDFALKSLFLFPALFAIQFAFATFEFTPQILSAHKQIYNLYLKDASRILDRESSASPENMAVVASRVLLLFAEATAADVDEITRRNLLQIKKILKDIESDKNQSIHHLLARIEIFIYSGMLQLRLNNRWRSASEFLSAYNLAKSAYSHYPKDAMVKLLWGNMIATIGSLPPEMRKYLSIIGFSGDVQKGLSLMKSAHKSIISQKQYKPYLTKANLLYILTYKQLIDNEEVIPEKEGINIHDNLVTAIICAKILMEQGYNDRALAILETIKQHPGQAKLHYYNFLLGKARLAAGSTDAEPVFLSFLNEYRGIHHIKATYKYLSWHYLLNDDLSKADSMRLLIPSVGASVIGPDQQAAREAEVPLNKVLIKARVLFDGGYLEKSLNVLLSDSTLDCCTLPDEKAEYYYRLGRIYQKQGLPYLAINAFEKAVEIHDNPAFNRANSALQAALLFEKLGNYNRARSYFQMCLAMKNFPYYEGLHQKAKAGLIRIDAVQ